MNVHLLTIGDEILLGQIVDTNSAWMSRQLNLNGMNVIGKSSVGDTAADIVSGIKHAAFGADVVILTGGLGPTRDDITKKTLANLFNTPLVFHSETHARIAAYFEKVGRPMPPSMTDQATLPEAANILTNKVGMAPGMWFEKDGKVYVSLPGVPFEMEYLMSQEVIPRLRVRFELQPVLHRMVLTAGEGESNIAHRLEGFEDALPERIKLAYLPALGQVRLRLTAQVQHVTETTTLNADLDRRADELSVLLSDIVFGQGDSSLEKVVGEILMAQNKQFGTAESCTGGYVAHLITSVPGSSKYFPGSIVSYSYAMKTQLLGVKTETLEKYGAVSEETVVEMAKSALDRLGVDVALSISGIAGPDGGTPDKPVGTVWMAVADRQRHVAVKQLFGRDRLKNIQLTGTSGLNLVRKFLLGEV